MTNNKSKVMAIILLVNAVLAGVLLNNYFNSYNTKEIQKYGVTPSATVKLILVHTYPIITINDDGSPITTYQSQTIVVNNDPMLRNFGAFFIDSMLGSGSYWSIQDETGTWIGSTEWEYPKVIYSRIECGTGTTTPQCNDYTLSNLVTYAYVNSISQLNTTLCSKMSTVLTFTGSYAITEWGLMEYVDIGGGTDHFLVCHDVAPTINVNSGDTITATYEIDWNS